MMAEKIPPRIRSVELRRRRGLARPRDRDRKSTRLNSSHSQITDAVFCLHKNNVCDEHEKLNLYRRLADTATIDDLSPLTPPMAHRFHQQPAPPLTAFVLLHLPTLAVSPS